MKKKLAVAATAGTILIGSLLGTGTANATADVCDGIDEASSYTSYLINAWVWGKAFNIDPESQAENIVSSVLRYCPWHAAGIRAAAGELSDSGSYAS